MREVLAKLYELQVTDSAIEGRQQELARLDRGEELGRQVEALRAQAAEAEQRRHALEVEAREQEYEMRALEEKRKGHERQLYGGRVSNPKKLEELEHEVAMLARESDRRAERALELMEETEAAGRELQEVQAGLAAREGEWQAAAQAYQRRSAELAAELAQLQAQRSQVEAELPRPLLAQYQRIRNRQPLAVVRVAGKGTACPGCHLGLSADLLKALKTADRVLNCENCGRILHWQD